MNAAARDLRDKIDSNGSRIIVYPTDYILDDCRLVIVRLMDDLSRGYIAMDDGTGGFGDESCPSSYGMSCVSWFGEGERYPTAEDALTAILSDM